MKGKMNIQNPYNSTLTSQVIGARARTKLHEDMIKKLVRCPLQMFEAYPIGRIINRFSYDMFVIDQKLPSSIQVGIKGIDGKADLIHNENEGILWKGMERRKLGKRNSSFKSVLPKIGLLLHQFWRT